MATKEAVLDSIERYGIRFIDLWFIDIAGQVKSMSIPAHTVRNVIEHGAHFDGSAIEGMVRVAESDMVLRPDLATFAVLPWDGEDTRTARLICNIYTPEDEPFIGDPRAGLIRMLKQAEQMGFSFKTGMELEFFLFNRDSQGRPVISAPYDRASYFDMSTDEAQTLRRKMLVTLEALGISVDSTHSEIGSGQHEIDLHYADALTAADQVLTARVALKAVAHRHNLHCTFMPRPSEDLPGSGMHTHQSLHELGSEDNVFADTGHEYGISELARQFLAGQLVHARGMCAVLAPLVNSYKRLGTSFEAPVHVTWAHINRSALIRVPSLGRGQEAHTRLELRCPDPSSNPYLATTVMLAAGLDGIRQKMTLPDPLEETLLVGNRGRRRQVETLPNSLGAALEALAQDDVILGALGAYISDRYLAAKTQEFDEYKQRITDWELNRYVYRY